MVISHSRTASPADRESRQGLALGLTAYVIWGLSTGWFKLMPHIPPLEIVAHRAAWAVPFAVCVLLLMGGGTSLMPVLRNWKIMRVLMVSATIIVCNWSMFIWAVANGKMLEASLAYYINPLVSVLLGFVLLRERLSRSQVVAIALAGSAVVLQTVAEGIFPGLALTIATTFAVYGYLRKTVPVGAVQGFLVETLLMLPFSIAAIAWFELTGQGHMFTAPADILYLLACTIVTGVPLMMFSAAARRLPLSTLGLMQYVAPTIGFAIAVWVFNEPLTWVTLVAFILIWIALAIFSWAAFSGRRASLSPPPSAP
ncbi:EamA family transporter RarD [Rhodoligotrophos defluvii]|uniref:EamA family transporter RarD n=1 Tax=Rhodoligotrophos defluvii TaxID=2561934 RepID=UPI0010C9A20F|nr:EamA family transporter RarD [Rhodoligotrophos defluvii]